MNRDRIDWAAVRAAGDGQRAGTWFWIPFLVGLGLLIGAGIFVVAGASAANDAGVGAIVSAGVLTVSGLATVVTAFVIRRDFRAHDERGDEQTPVGERPDTGVDSFWNR